MFGKIFMTQLRNCVMLVTPLITHVFNNRVLTADISRIDVGILCFSVPKVPPCH